MLDSQLSNRMRIGGTLEQSLSQGYRLDLQGVLKEVATDSSYRFRIGAGHRRGHGNLDPAEQYLADTLCRP